MNKVNNAIILAAGRGTRLLPLTYAMPKALVPVRGQPLIERLIKQLLRAGVSDITVVVGYKHFQLQYLSDKYNAQIVYNPQYNDTNNITSLYLVRHKLHNTYLLSCDHWICDSFFDLSKSDSWYCCTYVQGDTTEWCAAVESGGKVNMVESNDEQEMDVECQHGLSKAIITSVIVGGKDSFVLNGPAYLDAQFCKVFVPLLQRYYNDSCNHNLFWENVWIQHIDKLDMHINNQTGNVVEIDSIDDLVSFDVDYSTFGNKIIPNVEDLVETVGVDTVARLLSEDGTATRIEESMTNITYKIKWRGVAHVLRLPGEGTDVFINRRREQYYTTQAVKLGVSPPSDFYNYGRIKLTQYISQAKAYQYGKDDVCLIVDVLNRFYKSARGEDRSLKEEIELYESLYNTDLPHNYCAVKQAVLGFLYSEDGAPRYKLEVSHGDTIFYNFLIESGGRANSAVGMADKERGIIPLAEDKVYLVDFEYAGLLSRYWDYGHFVSEIEYYQGVDRRAVIEDIVRYESALCRDSILAWSFVVDFVWTCWAIAKHSLGIEYKEYINRKFALSCGFFLESGLESGG